MNHTTAPFPRAVPAPVIVNPQTGDQLVVLASGEGDEPTRLRFTLPPASPGTPLHRHPRLEETFIVNAGRLRVAVGDANAWRDLLPGESVHIAPGLLHRFWNPHPEPVTFETVVTPGRDFECFIRAHYGLARAGLAGAGGMPRSPLQLAVMLRWADFQVPNVPGWLQNAVIGGLARLARITGDEKLLRRHAA